MIKLYAKNRAVTRGWVYCLAAITLFWLAPAVSMAQISTYSFSQSQGTYTPVSGAAETIFEDPNVDDNTSTVNLNWTFRFNNVDYTAVTVSNNGMMALGSGVAYGYTAIADGTGAPQLGDIFNLANSTPPAGGMACIVPFALDIRMNASSYLKVERGGTAPNRTVRFEWGHERRYDSPDGNEDDFNFQVVLYETSNVIEFVYGTFTTSTSSPNFQPQVGLRGQDASGTDIINIAGAGFGAAARSTDPVARIVVTDAATAPSNGLTYRFAPIPPAPNDIGVVSFAAPRADQTSCFLSTQERVRAVVRNYGTNTQTSAQVCYTLNSGQPQCQTMTFSPALLPNSTDTVTFTATADMSTAGTYSFRAYTNLTTEPAPNRSNDSSSFAITLSGPLLPPTTPMGTLSETVTNQWKEGRGRSLPSGNASNWNTGFPFSSETIALIFGQTNTTTADNNEWLLSPQYNITSGSFFLVFKAAITRNEFGSDTISNIGDDTVKVMISTDCGSTWRSLRKFSQTELRNGTINNTLKEFRSQISTGPASVRIAFFGTSNGTPSAQTWRFHLDDIEFKEVIPTDIGVTSVLSPASGQPGCLLSAAEVVTVVVKNYGSATQTSAKIAYRVTNGTTTTAPKMQRVVFSPPLAPGNEDTVRLDSVSVGADLSLAGTYRVTAYSLLPGESLNTMRNDTGKSGDIQVSAPIALPSPLITGFTLAGNNGWGRGRGLTSPSGGTSSWTFAFAFPSEYIGMTFSATTTTPQREWFFSPSYAGTEFTAITFKAGVMAASATTAAPNGMEDDSVSLKVSNDCGASWRTIRRFSQSDVTAGILSNVLQEFTFLVPSANQRISFGFFGTNNASVATVAYRFVLDDIRVKNSLLNDQGVVGVVNPVVNAAQCAQASVRPTVTIRNYGSAAQTSTTVSYTINGGAPVTETIQLSPALAPTASTNVTFSAANAADLSRPGRYVFRFYTTTNGEDNDSHLNDTLKGYTIDTRSAIAVAGTNTQNFDSIQAPALLPAGWMAENYLNANAALDWRVALGRGVDGSDAAGCWMLPQNGYSWITSPRYLIPSASGNVMQFDLRIRESARPSSTFLGPNDSIKVEISVDCGATWQRIGIVNFRNYTVPTQPMYITQTFPMGAYQGQEATFRIQSWMRRTDATGAWVDIDNFRVGAPVAVKGKIVNLGYSLMPNPALDRVTITGPDFGKAGVSVISSLGQQVASGLMTEGRLDLSLTSLTPGMYRVIVSPEAGGQRQVLTLVKE